MLERNPAPRSELAPVNARPQLYRRGFLMAVAGCLALSGCAGPSETPNRPIAEAGKASGTDPAGRAPSGGPQSLPRAEDRDSAKPLSPAAEPPTPRLVSARRPLQCVPYARRKSKIAIWGDSWRWWRTAAGRYQRGYKPRNGAVLVFKRNRRSRGHLAVVERVLSDRKILVSHANWLNRGRIHMNTPVQDVSQKNDWSVVRVWHIPGGRYGGATYRAHGFIYRARRPPPRAIRTRPLTPTS